jgi:uncharacterized membrane protein
MMNGLWHEGAALLVFIFSHSLTNRPAIRQWAARRLGSDRRVTLAYSALSLGLLAWIIVALRQAPFYALWEQTDWARWLPPIFMLPACLLTVGGMLTPNPFSIGPGGQRYDCERPGLLRLTRHPILWALIFWSLSHIPPNGDVAALMMFLPMALLATAGPWLLDRRRRHQWGEAQWQRMTALTQRCHRAMLREMGWMPWIGGFILYCGLLAMHPWVIGAWPLPVYFGG